VKTITFFLVFLSFFVLHSQAQLNSYDSQSPLVLSSGFSIFTQAQRTGIVNSKGEEICSFTPEQFGATSVLLQESRLEGFIYLLTEKNIGLFHLPQKKMTIAPVFERTRLYEGDFETARRGKYPLHLTANCAIGRKEELFYLIDPATGKESEGYADVYPLENGFYFARKTNGQGLIVHGPASTASIYPMQCVDAFAQHFIGEVNGRCGLFSAEGDVAIPLEYDDIYFIGADAVWLKRGGKWALSNFSHQLLSDFVYTDIEKTDSLFFDAFLQVTGLEAHYSDMLPIHASLNITRLDFRLNRMLHGLQQLAGSRRLYTTLFDGELALKYLLIPSEKGMHLSTSPFRSVETEVYEKVFYIPYFYAAQDWIATQKKGKVGQPETGWKYDRVTYQPPLEPEKCSSALWIRKNKFYAFVYSEKKKTCLLKRYQPK
jgi:hypothetical protein